MTKEQVKIGLRVKTTVAFAGVPAGTEGVMDELYSLTPDSRGVTVAWDLPEQPLPKGYQQHDGRSAIQHGLLRDGFDLDDELHYLNVV